MSASGDRPPSGSMPLPRGLVILASLWIFASWALTIGLRPPVAASLASFMPGVRLMMASLAVGLCVAWPLLRLSGPRERWPVLRVSVDLLTLAALFHVVIWPLRLATPWPPSRLALMDAILFAWLAITAAVLTVALAGSAAKTRVAAMAACIGIAVIGLPMRLLTATTGMEAPPAWLQGPVMATLTLGGEPGEVTEPGGWAGVAVLAGAAAAAWTAAWWWIRPNRGLVATPRGQG